MESIKTITIKDKTYQLLATLDDKGKVISETYLPIGDYLTEIPSEYVTETELGAKNYATTTQLNTKLDKSTYDTEKGNFANKVTSENVSESTKELQPNTYYIFGEVETLTITLATEIEGILNEYMFQFTSGATATTLNLPETVKWVGESTIEANKIYQVSIINNQAVIGGVNV